MISLIHACRRLRRHRKEPEKDDASSSIDVLKVTLCSKVNIHEPDISAGDIIVIMCFMRGFWHVEIKNAKLSMSFTTANRREGDFIDTKVGHTN